MIRLEYNVRLFCYFSWRLRKWQSSKRRSDTTNTTISLELLIMHIPLFFSTNWWLAICYHFGYLKIISVNRIKLTFSLVCRVKTIISLTSIFITKTPLRQLRSLSFILVSFLAHKHHCCKCTVRIKLFLSTTAFRS